MLTGGLLSGCGLGKADLTCKHYRAIGTGSDPVGHQIDVVTDHIDTDVRDPALEISLAHMSAIYWCNRRDKDGLPIHDDAEVGDYLDRWK